MITLIDQVKAQLEHGKGVGWYSDEDKERLERYLRELKEGLGES